MNVFRDTWLVYQRNVLLVRRSPAWIILGIAQPVVYLILFAPLLKKALNADTMSDAYKIYVPGMLVALALAGGLYVGFGLLAELSAGVIERARVTSVSRVALLLGRAMRDTTMLIAQGILLVVISLAFGLFVHIGQLLLAFAILALINLSASSISYGIALKVSGPNVLGQVINNVAQPLMLLSGTLLPLTIAPLWLRRVADFNPFNWAVTGVRHLFLNNYTDSTVWKSFVIMGCLTVVAIVWSSSLFAKSVK